MEALRTEDIEDDTTLIQEYVKSTVSPSNEQPTMEVQPRKDGEPISDIRTGTVTAATSIDAGKFSWSQLNVYQQVASLSKRFSHT